MNTPRECILKITENDPHLAVPLLDFLLWATRTPGILDSADYDEALDMLFVKCPEFRVVRDEHIERRAAAA